MTFEIKFTEQYFSVVLFIHRFFLRYTVVLAFVSVFERNP